MTDKTEPAIIAGIPYTIASRPQRRYSAEVSASNLAAGGAFPVQSLTATGWVRRLQLDFTATYTTSAAAAVVAGDAPWNLITSVQLNDATGNPIVQPISGYMLYLVNKYLGQGTVFTGDPSHRSNPHQGPRYAFAAASTAGSANFSLRIDLEIDRRTGYGCVPNLDSNAALQLKVEYAVTTVAFTGGTASAATIAMRVATYYWAPTASMMGGSPVVSAPPGAGDYTQITYDTQTVNAASENLVKLNTRGSLIRGVLLVSRAAGVRTALTAASNVGVILDNIPIDESVRLELVQDDIRRAFGFFGADIGTSYAPLTAGTASGLDNGVMPLLPWIQSGGRDPWWKTVVGSLLQTKVTPGASATQLEIVTVTWQGTDAAAFYDARG